MAFPHCIQSPQQGACPCPCAFPAAHGANASKNRDDTLKQQIARLRDRAQAITQKASNRTGKGNQRVQTLSLLGQSQRKRLTKYSEQTEKIVKPAREAEVTDDI